MVKISTFNLREGVLKYVRDCGIICKMNSMHPSLIFAFGASTTFRSTGSSVSPLKFSAKVSKADEAKFFIGACGAVSFVNITGNILSFIR